VYEQVFNLESFHAFAHHAALRHVMHELVEDRLLIHPKPIARLIFPNATVRGARAPGHQAIAGDPESFTAWMPLHDCPAELGPLQILEGSHHYGCKRPIPRLAMSCVRPRAAAIGWADE